MSSSQNLGLPNPLDEKRLLAFYKESFKEYGDADARSLHWSDITNQQARFNALIGIANLNHQSVLDVGCGLGDMYRYMLERKIDVEYTGIDIMPQFIEIAHRKYPEATFLTANISDFSPTEGQENVYDYVLASGALSFKIENHETYYFSIIKKMYDLAKKGVAFNMLDKATHIDDEEFATYDSSHVADFCRAFCSHVEIVTDYLPQDFTIYLNK